MAQRVRVPADQDWRGSECDTCGEAIVGGEDDTTCEECMASVRAEIALTTRRCVACGMALNLQEGYLCMRCKYDR